MTRRFRYCRTADEIRDYLAGLGFQTREDYSEDGLVATGFTVVDTTVDLSYDIIVDGRIVANGMVRLSDELSVPDPRNPYNRIIDVDPQRYERSRKLYQKLYRRFSKPKPQSTTDTDDRT